MAKVLSSISLDSPASPLSASANDTFSFAGTPTLSGGGGVQRYDFKWEVDSGGGFVTIGAVTGLTTAATNPVVNTNSQAQQSITVTCADAGSYTIRMVGAPTSGGSYTVLSTTQTVEVAMAGIAGTMTAMEAGSDTAAISGTVAVSGTLGGVESGSDTLAGAGAVAVAGTLSVAETGADTFAASGTVSDPSVTGTLAASESGADSFAASGGVVIVGAFEASETGADSFAGAGGVVVSGGLAVQEAANDNLSGAGAVAVSGAMAASEAGGDTFLGSSGGVHAAVSARLCVRIGL